MSGASESGWLAMMFGNALIIIASLDVVCIGYKSKIIEYSSVRSSTGYDLA